MSAELGMKNASGKHVRVMSTPLNPTFIQKLGFAGVYLFFLFLLQNIDCGYSLETPRRGGSNVYPQSVLSKNKENIKKFQLEIFPFLKLKISVYCMGKFS